MSSSTFKRGNKRMKITRNFKTCDTCNRTFEGLKKLNNHKRSHNKTLPIESDTAMEDSSDSLINDIDNGINNI